MTLRYCRYLTSLSVPICGKPGFFDLDMNTRPAGRPGGILLSRGLVRAGATLAASCSEQLLVGIVRPANSARVDTYSEGAQLSRQYRSRNGRANSAFCTGGTFRRLSDRT